MIKKRLYALAAAAVMLFGAAGIPVTVATAAEDLVIPINDTFNEYITNDTPGDWTFTGVKARVEETAPNNKALMVEGSGAQSEFRKTVGDFGDYFVVSVDVKYAGSAPTFSIGLGTGQAPVTPLKIERGAIKTNDNKKIGSLRGNQFTTIAMVISKGVIYSAYINGQKELSDWKMPAEVQSGDLVFQITNTPGEESTLYFDNIRMYQSKRIYDCIPNAGMNPERVDRLDVDDDPGDYLYFDSYDMNTSKRTYENFGAQPKSNTLVCGRYDYTNPDRDDSIYLKKTTDDDCFFDISLNKHSYMHSTKTYSYFLMEGDYRAVDITMTATFLLRDSTSGASQQNASAIRLQPNGSMSFADGRIISNAYTNGQWFHLAMAIDLINHTIDVYVDGELIAPDVAINANIKTLNMLRFGFDIGSGKGEIYVKDMKLTGLVVPYENGVEVKTSQFPDETPIKEYLQDKIAFQGYSELLTVGGEKTKIVPAPIMEDGELYVAVDTLNKAFGLSLAAQGDSLAGESLSIGKDGSVSYNGQELTLSKQPKEQDGALYVPVLAFGAEVLGKPYLQP